jgi:signal transduction histidine kinase
VRQLGETLLEVNARHERLIDGLLLLARSDREITERSFVDLADIIEHVVAQASPGTVAIRTDARPAPTTGNPVLLERLVENLVDNAIRHNVEQDGWATIMSDTRPDGTIVLQASNTGPLIPSYEIPTLFEPFSRYAAHRSAGSQSTGLGLSIVQAVARAHDGDVQAEPRDGGGLIVTVTLPATDATP